MDYKGMVKYSKCYQKGSTVMQCFRNFGSIVPGLSAAVGVTFCSWIVERAEVAVFGYPWLDALVVAILLGTIIQTFFVLGGSFQSGIRFASKFLLEFAIVLLGGTISGAAVLATGPELLATVVSVVVISLFASYVIGRAVGLDDHLATLVSCGNSICGNSAIVAAAPVIDASSDEVASSIAFTAVLGIAVVLLLPLMFHLLGITEWQYGVMAGLTVYAVPQVLAATVPVGAVSAQIGTLVKLIRVLMLGPVILILGLKAGRAGNVRLPWTQLVPWFIVGFVAMTTLRSFDLIPHFAIDPLKATSTILTIVSMAGLGLTVDLKSVVSSGGRVLLAGCLSISMLMLLAVSVLFLLPYR